MNDSQAIIRSLYEDGWGKGTVTALASYIGRHHPGQRGFSPQNLWRMRQFFEAYRDSPELSSLLRELIFFNKIFFSSRISLTLFNIEFFNFFMSILPIFSLISSSVGICP